jgi:hypothetical protein
MTCVHRSAEQQAQEYIIENSAREDDNTLDFLMEDIMEMITSL